MVSDEFDEGHGRAKPWRVNRSWSDEGGGRKEGAARTKDRKERMSVMWPEGMAGEISGPHKELDF